MNYSPKLSVSTEETLVQNEKKVNELQKQQLTTLEHKENKIKDYRNFYKNYYKINFDNSFQIHHLDGNRNNNLITNLLLLPKTIHQKFHRYQNIHVRFLISDKTETEIKNYKETVYKKFEEVNKEIKKWLERKNTNYSDNKNFIGGTSK